MSIELMAIAWKLQLPTTKKLVLLAMCDWANECGICFPAMATVARKTCITKRHCQRIMGELIADNYIAVIGNQQGGIGSRRYQINVAALRAGGSGGAGDKLSPVVSTSHPPVTSASGTDDAAVTRTINNHHSDTPLPFETSSAFDWTYLPQLADADRAVVVDMLNGLDANQQMDIVDELAGALRAKAIKTQWPAWLRAVARRALAGSFVPNHALSIKRDRQRIVREVAEAQKQRSEEARRRDPAVRARGLEAVKAAIAEIGRPAKGRKSCG